MSQNRNLVSGWYGVGTALERFVAIRGPAGQQLLRRMFEAEHGRTAAMILRLTGEDVLLARFPNYRGWLESRIDLLNGAGMAQVELLRRVRAGDTPDKEFVPLLLSINCVAAGLRWTG